jgi:hypothetical protein
MTCMMQPKNDEKPDTDLSWCKECIASQQDTALLPHSCKHDPHSNNKCHWQDAENTYVSCKPKCIASHCLSCCSVAWCWNAQFQLLCLDKQTNVGPCMCRHAQQLCH